MLNIIMAVLLASAGSAAAAGPTETVQVAVQRVFSQQDGSAVKKVSTAERRADIRKVAESLFDFQEMSRRSLGPAWDTVSPAEQDEFVRLFTSLIANAYMGKIEQYTGEPITYEAEHVDGDEASVRSRVVTPKGSEVGIEYRLYRAPDRWAVYDINVDGVSLVGSYKAQFNRLLQRGSFADLLKQLRQKAGS
ncbi:MAG TPA: ABC transporter substrate-binding protein [Terriglobales bacterium]|nr:ABC transporter substrate-binding protein [Terriglobales bacterium]